MYFCSFAEKPELDASPWEVSPQTGEPAPPRRLQGLGAGQALCTAKEAEVLVFVFNKNMFLNLEAKQKNK